jgi:hypothetical protein
MVGRINLARVNCLKKIIKLTQHHLDIKALLAVAKTRMKVK